jgi:hypothetical protein
MGAGRPYAEGTRVPKGQSRTEIENLLERHDADAVITGRDGGTAGVMFRRLGRQYRITVRVPEPGEFAKTATGKGRTPSAQAAQADQEERRLWRALYAVLRAKIEAVESGIFSWDVEFQPYTVLPGGRTVAETVEEGIAQAYVTGEVPELLPGPRAALPPGAGG